MIRTLQQDVIRPLKLNYCYDFIIFVMKFVDIQSNNEKMRITIRQSSQNSIKRNTNSKRNNPDL